MEPCSEPKESDQKASIGQDAEPPGEKPMLTAKEIADKLRLLVANSLHDGRATGYLFDADDIEVLRAARDYLDAVKVAEKP